MESPFEKPYNPKENEPVIYKLWESSGLFNPDECIKQGVTKPDAKPFTIMMPPPNVTGVLHMGHALMLTLEDIMVRYHRMMGDRTLWLPGTDHAAIATQARVEKDIQKKESKSRYDLGRDELVRRITEFAQESHDTIITQTKTMGASCDWSREAYTLDEARSLAVRTMFKKMYDDGLVYRGNKIVNWDPKGQTTISDDEIVYEERVAKLYTFKYSKDFPISISTTRPETKVGDTAVAVHPDDARYQAYVGKEYDAIFCGVPIHIKVIADSAVEKDFGTGALGVTPAHSMIDWEMAERHQLSAVQVINEKARMMIGDERINGKKTTEARDAIVSWLRDEGLLEKEEDTKQNVATAERTGGIVEPLPKLQWFVDVNRAFTIPHSEINGIASGSKTTLKEIMRNAVGASQGQIEIIPDYFSKTYFHWIDNLRDWCISRQIWYGHRVPVWYRGDEITCSVDAPGDVGWVQDEDTLDTWFSSGLWTFSALGWPERTKDLEAYHPTDVLETGYEILFFWVARMILMTGYGLGQIPFRTIYLHGTVRDAQGRKMSKSLGNGIDPLEIAAEFGTDAGRMALIVGTGPGTDSKISKDKIKGYKHFANKLWNITRFVETHAKDADMSAPLTSTDQKLFDTMQETIKEMTQDMEAFRFYLAAEKIYHYTWHEFADIIIEEKKVDLMNLKESPVALASAKKLLRVTLDTQLKALHPFMPFVTEAIWQEIHGRTSMLMAQPWPTRS